MEDVSLRDLLLHEPAADDVEHLRRSLDAGARGDLAASLEHELAGSVILESPRRFILQDLLDHGDSAPGWAWSRWALDLAYRSMLFAKDPRTDLAVRHVMGQLYPSSLPAALDDETELRLLGTTIAATDRVAADLALFEFGGLADFLDKVASPGLLDRTDQVRAWAEVQVGAYELVGLRGCRLVLRDLSDGREVEALNIGASCGGADEAFVGRLVPISAEPGRMFASRPMSLDLATAQSVAEGMDEDDSKPSEFVDWLWALSLAQLHMGLPQGFHHTATTLYTSDLPLPEIVVGDDGQVPAGEWQGEEAGRIVELRSRGHSALVANALGVLEVGIIAAEVSDTAAAAVSPHVLAALGTPGAFEAAQLECTGPGTAEAWRILTGVVPEHVAARCRTLAAVADARAAAASTA